MNNDYKWSNPENQLKRANSVMNPSRPGTHPSGLAIISEARELAMISSISPYCYIHYYDYCDRTRKRSIGPCVVTARALTLFTDPLD